MKTVELGSTGTQVSQLALGSMLMGTSTDEATSVRILEDFVAEGGTFVDTANCYAWWHSSESSGHESEELLGRWFTGSGKRDEVFLATKGTAQVPDRADVWAGRSEPDWDLARQRYEGAGADTVRRAIDDSLRRLKTDHVDLWYVHVDDRGTPLEETLEALAGIVEAGKARYIGWSNVHTWRVERIRRLCAQHGWPTPVALQQQHTYLRRRAGLQHSSIVDDEQWDYLTTHPDLTLVAYSPILKGVYDDPAKRVGHWAMGPYQGPDAEARIAVLTAVAAEVGATPNQVVLAWHLRQRNPRVIPLMGPRTWEQYRAGMDALDVVLSDEQFARLEAAGA